MHKAYFEFLVSEQVLPLSELVSEMIRYQDYPSKYTNESPRRQDQSAIDAKSEGFMGYVSATDDTQPRSANGKGFAHYGYRIAFKPSQRALEAVNNSAYAGKKIRYLEFTKRQDGTILVIAHFNSIARKWLGLASVEEFERMIEQMSKAPLNKAKVLVKN